MYNICKICNNKFIPYKNRKLHIYCSRKCYEKFFRSNKKNKLKKQIRDKKYRKNNINKLKISKHIYYIKNKKLILLKCKKYRINNKEKKAIIDKKYRQKNKDKLKEYKRIYKRNRELIDINFKLRNRLQHRIKEALKHNFKSIKTEKLLGCSVEELKCHLEKQFKPGMSWKKYGKWHIDHIKPCCKFDLSKEEEQLKCFNYKNLQPMWAIDNIKKGGRYHG